MPADRLLATSAGSSPRPIRRTHARSGLPSQRRTHPGPATGCYGSAFAAARPTSLIDFPGVPRLSRDQPKPAFGAAEQGSTRRASQPSRRNFASAAVRLERTSRAAARRDGTFEPGFVHCGRTRPRADDRPCCNDRCTERDLRVRLTHGGSLLDCPNHRGLTAAGKRNARSCCSIWMVRTAGKSPSS